MFDDMTNTQDTRPLSMYYYRGRRWLLEGFYIWLGKRLPAGLVFRAVNQLVEFADEKGMDTYAILEAQSEWMMDKMP